MISEQNRLFWGDAHSNLHSKHFGQLADSFAAARDLLDFWPIAYYPFLVEDLNGFSQAAAGLSRVGAGASRIINNGATLSVLTRSPSCCDSSSIVPVSAN